MDQKLQGRGPASIVTDKLSAEINKGARVAVKSVASKKRSDESEKVSGKNEAAAAQTQTQSRDGKRKPSTEGAQAHSREGKPSAEVDGRLDPLLSGRIPFKEKPLFSLNSVSVIYPTGRDGYTTDSGHAPDVRVLEAARQRVRDGDLNVRHVKEGTGRRRLTGVTGNTREIDVEEYEFTAGYENFEAFSERRLQYIDDK